MGNKKNPPIKLSKSRSNILLPTTPELMQSIINNVINVSTGLIFNEMVNSFRPSDILKIITDLPSGKIPQFPYNLQRTNRKNDRLGKRGR